uniref:NADH dehydrogenase subunit 6 n=1 Tax=Cricotopus flavozonatus TaxID=1667274 RepID=UPI002E7746C4|nr:NADH dehydrogenase subunit 6 [Cricotopus flavozonatus]WPM93111.1 NADH dehydrogenase subunit 6 [Cricotopus flavozonatus]
MFNLFIYLASLTCSTIFVFMKHPLAMGLMLLIQTFFICLLSGLITKTFWFSYVLFLIFLGGMLVLFIYVTSLASNEMFNFSMKLLFFSLCNFFFIYSTFFFMDKNLLMTYISNHESESIVEMKNLLMENSLMLNKLYNFPINLMTILLMIYLFLTLIAVVKITNVFEGPLRPNF